MTAQAAELALFAYPTFSDSSPEAPIPGRLMAAKLALSVVIVVGLLHHFGLAIAPRDPGFIAASLAMLGLAMTRLWAGAPGSRLRRQVRDFSEDALVFCLICLLGVVASYPVAAGSSGFVDPALARMDAVLHFDWPAWYRRVSDHPLLQHAETVAYAGIFVSPFIILGYLAWEHRRLEARVFLLTFWVATVLTLALFWWFPAEGPLAYLWHGHIPYMPTSALYQEELIPVLRTHRMSGIEIGSLRGLVCAPSFHTVSAVLYMAVAWPIARLRRVVVPLNVAMLLATPIEGNHYLSDMIAGAGVALVALAAVRIGRHLWASRRTAESRLHSR